MHTRAGRPRLTVRREIVVNAAGRETRVAILEDGTLVEVKHERADERRMAGDIYIGKVEAIVPGLQAAFIDIGAEKSGFLHASDLQPEDEEENGGGGGRRRRDRKYPPIQDTISRGQELLVQVTKEPIGTKGARVTTQISLPGRFLVYMPFSQHIGISRKIEDREQRARLRDLARKLLKGDSGGVIVRTVGEELTKEIFKRELRTLQKTWKKVRNRADSTRAPNLVHEEAKLTSGVIRDLFSDQIDVLTVDSESLLHEVKSYVGQVDPDLVGRVRHYKGREPIFDAFGIEEQIRQAFGRRVDLPSGGHVVIEQTEALVAIDVNTGRYTGRKDPAETILRTNMDAAVEVARQLRLRDVGGIIVVDFIDMDREGDREKVLQQMKTHVGRDRARTKVFGISELGLLQMSRQRISPSLDQRMTDVCPYCGGSGRILAPETVVRRIERALTRAGTERKERGITILTHPAVALYLLEHEPSFMKEARSRFGFAMDVRDDPLLGLDQFRLLSHPADTDVTSKYVVE